MTTREQFEAAMKAEFDQPDCCGMVIRIAGAGEPELRLAFDAGRKIGRKEGESAGWAKARFSDALWALVLGIGVGVILGRVWG